MASLVGLAVLVPVLFLGVLVLVGAVVAAGRNEADPDGERPLALYLAAMAFVTIFLSLGAFSTIVASAVDAGLGSDDPSSFSESISIGPGGEEFDAPEPIMPDTFGDQRDNERIRTIVLGGLLLVTAGGLFVWHDGRLNDFRNSGRTPGWRSAQVSGYLICFFALLTALGAVVALGYAIFEAAAPGIAGIAERDDALQPGIVSAVVAVAAAGIFAYHWGRLDRRGTGGARLADVVAPLPPPPEPTPEPPRVRRRPLRVDPPS